MAKMILSLQPPPKAPGRLSQALTRLLMKRAAVVAVEPLGDRFRLVTLEGAALAGVNWIPGQKIQIAMGSAFTARTYTPMDWDSSAGRTRFLGYAHGDGPGSAWLRALKPGAQCDVFGPRASLDAGGVAGPLTLFGDETSMGLALALAGQDRTRSVSCVFEVGDLDSARAVTARAGLQDASLCARTSDETHLDALAAEIVSRGIAGMSFVLTGRASAIQRLRHGLKLQGVTSGRLATKAYWAPGKVGLD